jgi:catechol 2,3-dioxygenase-like lactoylglutathione lyase family enzyme
MITKLSHTTVYVLDQEVAKQFYCDKLGLEVRTDATMDGGFRWLTVGSKTQPDMEIALMKIAPGHMWDQETAATVEKLVKKGALGIGVFDTNDCQATYEELKKKGVEFLGPPEEKFYGIEAVGKDPFGNWFSMTQHKPH